MAKFEATGAKRAGGYSILHFLIFVYYSQKATPALFKAGASTFIFTSSFQPCGEKR